MILIVLIKNDNNIHCRNNDNNTIDHNSNNDNKNKTIAVVTRLAIFFVEMTLKPYYSKIVLEEHDNIIRARLTI